MKTKVQSSNIREHLQKKEGALWEGAGTKGD